MTTTEVPAATCSVDFAVDVVAYPPAWRVAAAVAKIFARGALLVTLAVMLLSDDPPSNPFKQMRLISGLFVAPELAAWCIARAFATRVRIRSEGLVLEQRGERIEIPLDAIAGVTAWGLPVPRGGLWLKLRSGRRFDRAIETADPDALVEAMIAAGASPELRSGLASVMAVFARARLASPAGFFENPILKFVVYSLVPTLPVFRLHQFITFGGTFGEYYTFGLKAYLLGFGLWWVSWAIGVLLFAAGVRAIVEVVALLGAAAVPSFAAGLRRGLEIGQRVIYYLGIPAWILLRLLS